MYFVGKYELFFGEVLSQPIFLIVGKFWYGISTNMLKILIPRVALPDQRFRLLDGI